jgi:hypothetical protein
MGFLASINMRYWLPYVTTEQNGIVGSMADDEQDELIRQYVQYFDSIKASLPPDLLLFGDRNNATLFLNDGEVRGVESDSASQHVRIMIEGDAYDQSFRVIGSRLFALNYREVAGWDYRGKASGLVGLDGDHLFDEIQLLSDRLFQHRMYFSGGIEITVRFGDFRLEYTDTLQPPRPSAKDEPSAV